MPTKGSQPPYTLVRFPGQELLWKQVTTDLLEATSRAYHLHTEFTGAFPLGIILWHQPSPRWGTAYMQDKRTLYMIRQRSTEVWMPVSEGYWYEEVLQ